MLHGEIVANFNKYLFPDDCETVLYLAEHNLKQI